MRRNSRAISVSINLVIVALDTFKHRDHTELAKLFIIHHDTCEVAAHVCILSFGE